MELTRTDIYELLGEVEELVVARLLESDASRDELREAVAKVYTGNPWDDALEPASSDRVDHACAVLRDLLDRELDASDWEPMSPFWPASGHAHE